MQTAILSKWATLVPALIILGACSTTQTEPVDEIPAAVEQPAPVAQTAPVEVKPQEAQVSGTALISTSGKPVTAIFYFDFDQSVVKTNGYSSLSEHAKYLSDHPRATLRIEGHGDERGSREYNSALGLKRAEAVATHLVARGASRSQFEVISYGEERPAVDASSEAAWSKNRRVAIKY